MYPFTWGRLDSQGKPLCLPEEALLRQLRQTIVGQDDVLRLMAGVVSQHLTLGNHSYPAILFMIGPSGVGKTRTAECPVPALRALNSTRADDGYLRLDMSECQDRESISRPRPISQDDSDFYAKAQRIDAPAVLAEVAILIDEIEKAHAHTIDVLATIIDAGWFSLPLSAAKTSGRVPKRNYSAAIFMFTGKMGAESIVNDRCEQQAFSEPSRIDKAANTRSMYHSDIVIEYLVCCNSNCFQTGGKSRDTRA